MAKPHVLRTPQFKNKKLNKNINAITGQVLVLGAQNHDLPYDRYAGFRHQGEGAGGMGRGRVFNVAV